MCCSLFLPFGKHNHSSTVARHFECVKFLSNGGVSSMARHMLGVDAVSGGWQITFVRCQLSEGIT